jgi:hypothetical protein
VWVVGEAVGKADHAVVEELAGGPVLTERERERERERENAILFDI